MSEPDIPQSDVMDGANHPRLTQELFGQSSAVGTFLSAYNSERLHHAWMITGPRGVGKATLAWKIARFVLSQPDDSGMFGADTPTNLDVPADHPVSRRIQALGEPSLFLARRPWDEKTKKLKSAITVEEIRKLKSFFTLSAADGGWRVAIVDAADEMNAAASNALLKVLEEPPEKVLLILICHQPSILLPTIRSRCRTLKCETLTGDALQSALGQAGYPLGAETVPVSVLAAGSVGASIELLSSDGVTLYQSIVSAAARAPKIDREIALKLANACVGKANANHYVLTLRLINQFIVRLAKFGAMQPNDFSEAATGEAQTLAKLAPNLKSAQKWATLSQELNARTAHAVAVNLDPSTVILDMFLKIEETAQG